jgi:cellulose synthase operon protein YhjQ
MNDRGPLYDQNETPEDVATLYSWANLHGAKYRDFSESRAQTREKARMRVQEAINEEHVRANQGSEPGRAAEVQHMAEAKRLEEEARRAEFASQQAAQQAAQHLAQQASQQTHAARPDAWQQPLRDRFSPFAASEPVQPAAPHFPPQPDYPRHAPPQAQQPIAGWPQQAPMREDSSMPPQNPWAQFDQPESAGRPAWLTPDRMDVSSQSGVSQAPEDTLQGSRDRLASRWYALRGVFEGGGGPVETAPAAPPARAPVVAVFSLAGGVGKTSLVATLGRALSARGERVLLVDTAPYGLLPFFFGAHDQRPGLLRTFSPPGTSGDAPIQMVTIDAEGLGPETSAQEGLTAEISKYSRGLSRVIVDLATASGAITRRVIRLAPLVLVPMVPDMNSVVSVSSIDSFFQHNGGSSGKQSLPYYVLNQFDASLPLHLDIREVLREQLGDRLLSFVLRRAPAVSEALAEGMTVMDYAPNSTVAEDFGSLAGWVKSQSAPASSTYRGVRWSER